MKGMFDSLVDNNWNHWQKGLGALQHWARSEPEFRRLFAERARKFLDDNAGLAETPAYKLNLKVFEAIAEYLAVAVDLIEEYP